MATGNLNEVKQALRRHRDGLRDLLRLEEIPDLSASSGDLERLEKERTEPLAGEKVTVWAILAPGALQLQEPEVESGGESDENMEARDGLMDEQEALQVEEAAILEDDDVEVLGFSDEEENMQSMMEGTGFIRVKNFNHREAYRKLQSLNLMLLPQGGVHLSYHCSTRTWTGYYPEVKAKELCFTHGGRTLRTEAESLLLVIRNLLKLHTERFPRDALWRGQYQKVLDALATQAYL